VSKSGRLYQPNSQKLEELERPGDVFSLTLKIKTVSKSGRLYQPNSQKLEELEHPVDVFSSS
ncbi:hypothetical protein, partial [Streptococcus mitis]|uniref:hypothetical protein n=1 Tax=Streptococcus mitis TaxID=28037 RepID=UPI0039F00AF1